ncbi:hypothetical protein [uncultured Sphingomonas sp.]|uniref:hypothetical protein n=1 Tax=uncultured Sphingomonas sp. TaxID=158754 RepID=UPI0035CBB217
MKVHDSRPIAVLRAPVAVLLTLLAAMPFLLTTIPPLTDVPGHMGAFAVQTAAAGDSVLRYFAFHWTLTLNLASELIVQAAHPLLGIVPLIWLLCAATPALTVIGILSIARVTNRRGAYALPWSLLFVFNSSFLWGFLNFALTAAFALMAFAAWLALERKRRLRGMLFLAGTPMLLIGHGVAGVVAIGMIAGHAVWEASLYSPRRWSPAGLRTLAPLWPPLLAAVVTIAIWRTSGSSDGGATLWLLNRKLGAVVKMLRDQDKALDIGSVVCCAVVWILGQRWGARLSGGAAGAVILVAAIFVATPSLISGSDEIDTRLAPLVPMLAFAMHDWRDVGPHRRRSVLFGGFALLALRFGVTIISFAQYDQRYSREVTALDHVPHGARVINLAEVDCHGWRSARLEHLGNLATVFRGAWTNSHWSIDGIQLLRVDYRPSAAYYNDPSQMVFPAQCVDPVVKPYAGYRPAQTALNAVSSLPLNKVDYLWIIGTRLPANYHDDRIRRIWNDDISELYIVTHR